MDTPLSERKHLSRLKAWGTLFFGFFCIWAFAFIVGPWIQEKIPTMNQIFQVIEERDIDSTAYFYTEIKASYDGERYLRESIRLGAPQEAGVTWPFVSGIVLCCVILALGYRYLPME